MKKLTLISLNGDSIIPTHLIFLIFILKYFVFDFNIYFSIITDPLFDFIEAIKI
jgi:hypothetical protein